MKVSAPRVCEWWLVRGGAATKWDNYLFAVVLQTVITLIAVIMLLAAQANM